MKKILPVIILINFITCAKAQYPPLSGFNNTIHSLDTNSFQKKWFFTKQIGISTGFAFYKSGNASFTSVPVSFQLNRRLNNNLFAFGNVSAVPGYINFKQAFINSNNKSNSFFYQPRGFNTFSSASLGLMYVNDQKTFSISGSIGIERNDYPLYYNPINNNQNNNIKR